MKDGRDLDDTTGRLRGVRRTLEQRIPTETSSSIDGGVPWVSGIVVAGQAALFSLAIIVIPIIATAVAATAGVAGNTSGWTDAVPLALRLWLLGHGVPISASQATITLIPIGLSVIAVLGTMLSAQRSLKPTVSAWVVATICYTMVPVGLAFATQEYHIGQMGAAIGGGLGIGALGFGWGVLRTAQPHPFRSILDTTIVRIPTMIRLGIRAGSLAAGLSLAAGTLLLLMWIIAGRSTITTVMSDLQFSHASALSLGVAQLFVIPNMSLWSVSWLSGIGFGVGAGTHFSPQETVLGPLPALPLLGALPSTTPPDFVQWVPLVLGVIGLLAGWFIHSRVQLMRWWHVVPFAALIGGTVGVLFFVLLAMASGSIGPGRMADVGVVSLFAALTIAGEIAAGALVFLIACRREFHRAVGVVVRLFVDKVRPVPAERRPIPLPPEESD